MLRILAVVVFVSITHASFAQDCDISDFQEKSFNSLSDIQKHYFYSSLTEIEYDKIKRDAAISGQYKLISGSASYSDFRESLRMIEEVSKTSSYTNFQQFIQETSLSPEGLAAYRACLESKHGVSVYAESLSGSHSEIQILYRPAPGQSIGKAEVIDYDNVSNINAVESLLGNDSWGHGAKDLKLIVKTTDSSKSAYINIKFGDSISRAMYFREHRNIPVATAYLLFEINATTHGNVGYTEYCHFAKHFPITALPIKEDVFRWQSGNGATRGAFEVEIRSAGEFHAHMWFSDDPGAARTNANNVSPPQTSAIIENAGRFRRMDVSYLRKTTGGPVKYLGESEGMGGCHPNQW